MKDVLGTWLPIFHLPTLTEDPAYYRATDLNTEQLVPSEPSNTGFSPQLSRIGTIIVFKMQARLHPPKTISRTLKIQDLEHSNQISICQSYT